MTTGRMDDKQYREWQRTYPARLAARLDAVKAERAKVRDAAPVTLLTLDLLIEKLGWTPQYAAHFVQPYCDCGDTNDGWAYCAHARDLGLTP